MYQLDKTTEIVLNYISKYPFSARDAICLLDKESDRKKRKHTYNEANTFKEYAYSCVDYLLELGLIYPIEKDGHTYYLVSAKGNAYKRYKALNFVKEYFPYFVSIISLLLSITSLVISITT